MKDLKFEANLACQHDAISAITDVFKGQQVASGVLTVRKTRSSFSGRTCTCGRAYHLSFPAGEWNLV